MKIINELRELIAALRGDIEQSLQKEKNRELTDAEHAMVEEEVLQKITEFLLEDKPPVDAKQIHKIMQRDIPSLEMATKEEKEVRTQFRTRAVKSYALSQVLATRFLPGNIDINKARPKRAAIYCMTEKELADYVEAYKKSEPSYYQGKGLSPEQVSAKIAEQEKEQWKNIAFAVKRTMDQYGDLLASNLTDEELITNYPNLLACINLIQEAHHKLFPTIRKYQFDIFPDDTVDRYDDRCQELMDYASFYGIKMAMLTDPYYADIKLEQLWEVPPGQLYEAEFNFGKHLENEIVQNKKVLIEEIEQEKIVNKMMGRAETNKDREDFIQIDSKENILKLASDVSSARTIHFGTTIGEKMGMSYVDMKKDILIFDQKGKKSSYDGGGLDSRLENEEVLFLVNRSGEGEIFPIILDRTKKTFTPLIGKDAIRKAGSRTYEKPAELGRWARFVNSVSEWLLKHPSQAMQRYQEDLKQYNRQLQINKIKDMVENKTYPQELKEAIGKQKVAFKEQQIVEGGKKSISDLAKQKGFETVVAAATKVLEAKDMESIRLLASLSKEQLMACNTALLKEPNLDFGKLLKDSVESTKATNRPELEKVEPQTRARAKTQPDLVKQ